MIIRFDPAISQEFFKEGKEQELSYTPNFPYPILPNLKDDKSILQISVLPSALDEFFSSEKGVLFKQGIEITLNKIIVWVKANGRDADSFETFKSTYLDYSGSSIEQNSTLFPLYSIGMPLLAGIAELLETDIPLPKRLKAMIHLAESTAKCGPGVYTVIADVYTELAGHSNLPLSLMKLRRNFASECALSALKHHHIRASFEIHYVNALLNKLAKYLKINIVEDSYIKHCDQDILRTALKALCDPNTGISKKLTASNIIESIVSCLSLDTTIEELNSSGHIEKIVKQINIEINGLNTKYYLIIEKAEFNENEIKEAVTTIIQKHTPALQEYNEAGNRILRQLNSIRSSITPTECVPTLDYGLGKIYQRFKSELDFYGIDDKFDHEEIITSDDYVTYKK